MARTISSARLQLSYPICACDFDPHDANRLVVGGGGGPGRTGVGNKISIVDVSHEAELELAAELELSKDEDNVASLAVGRRKGGKSLLVYAGVNSSVADIQKGKNEHLRVFTVDEAKPAKAKASVVAASGSRMIAEAARHSLFTSSKEADVYQRLLKVSLPFEGSYQIGAAATGFGKAPQIAVFDVAPTSNATLKPRGRLILPREAMDLDVMQTGDDQWQLAYCDEYDVYIMDVAGRGEPGVPAVVYTMPQEESTFGAAMTRPTFRSIRYLTPGFVLLALNAPQSVGVALQVLRLPATAGGKARLASSVRLPYSVKRSVGMAVRNLCPPATPSAKQGDTQFVAAVTDQNCSITLFTFDYQSIAGVDLITNSRPITTLKKVHAGPVSGLAFSHVVPLSPQTGGKAPPPPHLKLASVSMVDNSCVVQTLPLQKKPQQQQQQQQQQQSNDKSPPPRYVLALKASSVGLWEIQVIILTAVLALILGVMTQGFLEVKGLSRPVLGARNVVPASWHGHWKINIPTAAATTPATTPAVASEFLPTHRRGEGVDGARRIVVRMMNADDTTGGGVASDTITVDEHDPERYGEAREWDDLPVAQRHAWKEALRRAGHWTENMGETVLQGVLFGQMAEAVGAAADAAVRG